MLLVNDVASVGGGTAVMLDIARLLHAADFETHVACPSGELARESKTLGATWHEFKYSRRRLLTPVWRIPRISAFAARVAEGRRLADLAVEIGADILHTGALIPHLDAMVAQGRSRTRVLWHLNQVHPSYLFAGLLPDRIISVSKAALVPATWRSAVGLRSAIVPNGVDLRRFRPGSTTERKRARSALGLGESFTLVTVARLEPLKGIDTLIRAAARVRSCPVLLVIGDSTGFSGGATYAEGLRTLAQDLDVDVRFLGSRTDVAEILRAADLFVFASRWEAFGLVLAEASASGLPVVSSNTGGCPEVIVDGVTGVLVAPDDVAGFAAQFDLLANNPALRERLGKAGRQQALARFDVARLADRLLPYYAELAGA